MSGPVAVKRITPAWSYKPGPDVSDTPPPGLVRAQALARQACAVGLAALEPGMSEQDIDLVVSDFLARNGIEHVWTITVVGLGENAKVCFPTNGPGAMKAAERDVLMLDVHPITPDGSWGDCTRCRVLGDYPEARTALTDLERIHAKTLDFCRPGMPAKELFGFCHELLVADGFVLLDLLGNIGHSLTAGAAYLHNFIDAGNDAAMWGAWAIEPFASRDDIAVKVEDLVWFGRDTCTVI
ncbi:MAG TPA: M24 family metallopeptidase [Kaistia sp.]|nr:M24 family metallopeptidase [Kaistia sp.]